MATFGQTSTPSFGNQFYGLNVQNQAYIQSQTMPSPGGYVTALSGYFQTNQNGTATCYLAMWGGGGGSTLLTSIAVSVTQGNHTPGGQGWQTGTLATPYFLASGTQVNMGWEVPRNNGMTFSFLNSGSSFNGTNTAALPNDLANVASTGDGLLGMYATYTPLAVPSISSESPTHGTIGDTIVVSGTFDQISSVTFNGIAASFSWTSSTVTLTIPSGATTGNIVITNAAGSASIPCNVSTLFIFDGSILHPIDLFAFDGSNLQLSTLEAYSTVLNEIS